LVGENRLINPKHLAHMWGFVPYSGSTRIIYIHPSIILIHHLGLADTCLPDTVPDVRLSSWGSVAKKNSLGKRNGFTPQKKFKRQPKCKWRRTFVNGTTAITRAWPARRLENKEGRTGKGRGISGETAVLAGSRFYRSHGSNGRSKSADWFAIDPRVRSPNDSIDWWMIFGITSTKEQ
jgi:hypothetical protein